MRKYLTTLHTRSNRHKKRFALLVSSFFTLFIFGMWSLVNFGTSPSVVAEKEKVNEIGPFQSIRANLASSFDALNASFDDLKTGFQSIDVNDKYQEMRDNALDIYGR